MKTLFLVRHAKASREQASLSDRERPLAGRGGRDAAKMGRRLRERGVKLDLMVSSPALRALTTAQIIAPIVHYKPKRIEVDDRLYPGEADEMLNAIRAFKDGLNRVMLVGHNPALSGLAQRLSGEVTELPTCAVVQFTFGAQSWRQIGKGKLENVTLDYPKRS